MIEGIPKISVLVITYNQENVIARALDSLIAQKDYLYEICVSDDCSKDRTWDVLQEYATKYPGLFVLNRNNPNVGIFENIEKTWTMPSGDIIYQLAGDDEAGEGWFQRVVEHLLNNKIDYHNELFSVYGDYKAICPNGDSCVYTNELILRQGDVVKYSLLGMIGNRSSCFSINILKQYQKVSQGRSHIAETAQDIQLPFYTKEFYYLPYVGNMYYAGTGVSSKIDSDTAKERIDIVPYAFEFLKNNGYKIGFRERMYCKYNISIKEGAIKGGLYPYLKAAFWFFFTYCTSINTLKKSICRKLFSMRRRVYHTTPIKMKV